MSLPHTFDLLTSEPVRRDTTPLEPGLYVVATPIGHLDDMTFRGVAVLRQVAAIACEDTRVTAVLTRHYQVTGAALLACHEHNEREVAERIVERIRDRREAVALVSDAGTPGISDPGARLIERLRADGIAVFCVPGPCAAIAAVSIAGQFGSGFAFMGFLAVKGAVREAQLQSLARSTVACVLYEAPHRIAATLVAIRDACGMERRVMVGRELTKKFEESIVLPASQACEWIHDPKTNRQRGEFVVIVDQAPTEVQGAAAYRPLLKLLLAELPASRAAKVAAAITGAQRQALYSEALAMGAARES
jgi:16S rRNA (cytidine1402-2'-O)-methyltransferase